ncbi:MAG: IS6 family transposase [Candidatus Thermoplasmatota archaeon]
MLSYIERGLESKKVFERKRKNLRTRALVILLYHYGLSLRDCQKVVSCYEPVSHEAIRLWYHKTSDLFKIQKGTHEVIAVDETKIKIHGRLHIVWAAIDVHSWEVLGVWISQGRASIEAYSFLRYILRKCKNSPKILVDGGPWYKPALKRLGVEWEHITFGLRNPVEQWFFLLKHRIKRFYKRWPHNASIDTAQEWMNSFVSMYHLVRC